jgi:serine/threonine protein phosphatase 1
MVMKPRTFVIGDIHGRANALHEVLAFADFRDKVDRLITLGDIVDGGENTREVLDRLVKIKHRIDITGNHDLWALPWFAFSENPDNVGKKPPEPPLWFNQGGFWTARSYDFNPWNVPQSHIDLLRGQIPYYVDSKNRLFVHGGFNPKVPIENQSVETLTWDRSLIKYAKNHPIPGYNLVFIGHTTTQLFLGQLLGHGSKPLKYHNLIMMDCGAGWNGNLCVMNVDNIDEYYLSGIQEPSGMDDQTEEFSWS